MIKRIIPLGFDSFGVRSMATFVETNDQKILVDPGVSLAPLRYGLEPHPLELRRLDETWNKIKCYAEEADVLIVTHYHYDHHDPDYPELYRGKTVFIKNPIQNINLSQKWRAELFLSAIKDLPKKLETADGKEFQLGETVITFSKAVCHGTNPRLGYVVEVNIKSNGESFLHTSDVEGLSLEDQTAFILDEKPNIVFADGPMTYMLGYRYSFKSLEAAISNLRRVINVAELHILVLDHHLLRDLNYKTRIKQVYEAADESGIKVQTAAEFAGKKNELLEALRRKLYTKYALDEFKVKKRPLREE
ncbi:MAG: MBL fold metallo-hydrolase [Candidatus Bathyarchaeota archaeon]|nr:MBL fold metallo-hydrolase [Candidatus Bathyarchaeota archaeon]